MQLVLLVLGRDRPGLNRAVADAVLSAGGNWLESHLGRLGGRYTGSALVEIPPDGRPALEAALSGLTAEGLEVRLVPAEAEGAPGAAGRRTQRLVVTGRDRPGIVREVSAALAGAGANIESFASRTADAPHAGGVLFRAEILASLPPGVEGEAVQAAIEAVSGEVIVDLA